MVSHSIGKRKNVTLVSKTKWFTKPKFNKSIIRTDLELLASSFFFSLKSYWSGNGWHSLFISNL